MDNSNLKDLYFDRGSTYGVKHFKIESSLPLGTFLIEKLELSNFEVISLIEIGAIYLNEKRGGPLRAETVLSPGDCLRVHTAPRRYDFSNIELQDLIVFENKDFVLINKPAGVPVHALVDNSVENIITQFKQQLDYDLKITSRLDIPTSGLLVYAKTAEFQSYYNLLVSTDRVTKRYLATVNSNTELSGVFTHYMEPSQKAPKTLSDQAHTDWQKCILQIESAEKINLHFLRYKIQLITGRTHQIRSQLGFLKQPILGDVSYGSNYLSLHKKDEIALQCYNLEFGSEYKFELPAINFLEKFKKNK